jgi:hypothetical protein
MGAPRTDTWTGEAALTTCGTVTVERANMRMSRSEIPKRVK